MLAALQGMVGDLGVMLETVEPARLHPRDAAAVMDVAARLERRAAALKTLVAERAADSMEWSRKGYRSAEDWLASETGTGYRDAAATLDASAKLEDLPAVNDALRKGELSAPKLAEIAPAATPENEGRLLKAAATENLPQLKRTCAKEKAAARTAEQEAARAARIHNNRHHRSWTDADGAYCYEGKTTAAVGARIEAAIAAEADKVFKTAYAEGRREPAGAYRSDALVNLIEGGGARVDTTVVIRVDESRLAGQDGMCETTSTGPVPVEVAIGAMLSGAMVKVVLHNGTDVTRVTHWGRHVPAEVRTAVFERDGYRCARPGCGATSHLELHHYRVDFAKGGPTAYWNLVPVCSFDHDLITHGGHRLEGGPGRWKWIPPP